MRLSFPKTNQSAGLIGFGKLFGALFFVGFFFGLLSFKVPLAEAKNCGGATACVCGDTVTSNYTLSSDLSCTAPNANGTYALIVGANGITIDGNGHELKNVPQTPTTAGDYTYGVYNSGFTNVTVQNLHITDLINGIYFQNGASGTIQNNVINASTDQGIDLFWDNTSTGVTITGNTIKSTYGDAIATRSTANYTNVHNNTFFLNNADGNFQNSGNNTYFDKENIGMIQMSSSTVRTYNLNDTVNFSVSLNTLNNTGVVNACNNCTYAVAASPTETVSSSKTGNVITGSFVAHRTGTYSLIVTSTDPGNGDVSHSRFLFFVGPMSTATIRYYEHLASPTHGQTSGTIHDTAIFNTTAPSATETNWCNTWTQGWPEVAPPYFFSMITGTSAHNWLYNDGVTTTYGTGIEQHGEYGVVDTNGQAVLYSATPKTLTTSYAAYDTSFSGLKWMMDATQAWYHFTEMFVYESINWQSTPAKPSYIDVSYTYPSTQFITGSSNEKVWVYSSTTSSTYANNAQIVLQNNDSSSATTTLSLSGLTANSVYSVIINGAQALYYPSDASGNSSLSVTVNANSTSTIDIAYVNSGYSLTYIAGSNGTISGQALQGVLSGGNGTAVTAVPNTNYHFVNWSDGSTANPRTDTNVQGNITVTANFAITTYTITYLAVGGDGLTGISGISVQTVNSGANGTQVTAFSQSTSAYQFDTWSDGSIVVARTETNVQSNLTYTAYFSPRNMYMDPGHMGRVTVVRLNFYNTVTQCNYEAGDWSIVTAGMVGISAINGISCTGSNNYLDIAVTALPYVTGNDWVAIKYTNQGTLGSVATTLGALATRSYGKIMDGAPPVIVSVTPANGQTGVSVSTSIAINFSEDINSTNCHLSTTPVNASFNDVAMQNGSWSAGLSGAQTGGTYDLITIPNTVSFASGTPVTVTVSGCQDSNGLTVIGGASYPLQWTFTTFGSPPSYTLTYTAGANGAITGSSPQTVSSGGSGTQVTAVPNTGYHFTGWSDSVGTASRTDANVTSNITATANFAINSYTLTYSAGANGTLTGTTSQSVNYGGSGSAVTAVPNTGYHFVNWSDSSTANPRTDASVTVNITVSASFAINTYTLTYAAGTGGTITGSSPQTVNYNASGTQVTAVPSTGYHFVNWSDSVSAASRTDANVSANITVTANFAINTFTLTYSAGANGTLTGSTTQTVNYNASGTAVTAVPNTGYHFVSWSDSVATASRTDSSVTGNITVTASFAIDTHTLTYSTGANGTLTGSTTQVVNYGASGTAVTAVPNTGYHFVNWSDSLSTNPRTDSGVTSDLSITATFAINTFTLTYSAGVNGSLTGTSTQTVNYNASGTAVTAVPATGYHFVNWSDSSSANPRTDSNVSGNITVTANFAINTYTLTYTAGAHGSLTGTVSQTVNYSASGTAVTAVPDASYHFVNWSDLSTSNPRTDANVTVDLTLTANFAYTTPSYTLTYSAGSHGSLTGSTPQTVTAGANGMAVAAVADSGYHFVNWSDSVTQNPRTDINVVSNITVTANFATNTFAFSYSAGIHGSLTGTTSQTVNAGANGIAVTAVPDAGYHFAGWSDSSLANPRTDANAASDLAVNAIFAINTYTLTYTAGAHGSLTGTVSQTVNYNASGTAVTAVPDAGYHLVSWSDSSTVNPRTDANVSDNINVTANFSDAVQSGGGGGPAIVYIPSITIRTPNSGAFYNAGMTAGLEWILANGAFTKYKVSYSTDNGTDWITIADSATSTSLSWIIPDTSTAQGKIKVEGYNFAGALLASAVSSGVFTIVGKVVVVNSKPTTNDQTPITNSPPPATDPTATGAYTPAIAIVSTPDINTDKGLAAPTTNNQQPTTPNCASDTLIKGSLPAVYFCGADGKRYVFVNSSTFLSWYDGFGGVQVISDADLAEIPLGGNVTYRPGKKMIKIQSDPRVYAVARGGVLRWVSTEAIARALFGDNWNKQIDDVSDAFFVNYRIGDPIVP